MAQTTEETTIRTPTHDPALLLKSTPPRAVRGWLDRERLQLSSLELSGTQVTAVLAPPGFGKTAQLNQWRRGALAKGGLAFWLTLDSRDDPLRFVRGLAYSAQASCGKRGFSEPIMQWIEECTDPQEAMTGWLAEVAKLAVDVVLLLDDADRLPVATRGQILPYLIGNAPANLHVALAARPTSALIASGALSTATITRVTASDLRFRLDESLTVLSTALGTRYNPEAGISLHELTEGWPLGIQLAVAALHRSGDLQGLLATATADIHRYFIDSLIDRQPAEAIHLLVRLAQFDLIHPELCSAVLRRDEAAQDVLRLQEETPLLLRAEDSDWMRLHHLAREVLRKRLQQLPQEERLALSQRAAAWYVNRGLYEEAAQQSLLAGNMSAAISLVERSAHQMTVQGRSAAVLGWYQRLSPEEIKQHPGLWAPAAWALAMSERHADAQPLIDLIIAQPQLPDWAHFEASLIRTVAAYFADRPDLLTEVLTRWPEPPPDARTDEVPIYWNVKAFVALYQGQPEQARLDFARIAEFDRTHAYSPVSYGIADYGIGLSYLWEGQYALAEQELRPALARAEERMDRRHPVACMLAALLAEACWESGQNDDLVALLAGRLVVLERHGLPDALMSAYKTLARVADQEGRQDQAVNLLESLYAIGQTRGMLRLQVVAQFELVRLHARHGRADTAEAISVQLDSVLHDSCANAPAPFVPWLNMHSEFSHAYALLGQGDSNGALQAVASAAGLATTLKRGRETVEIRLLRAEILQRQGSQDATAVLDEAISLAKAGGMARFAREHGSDQPQALTVPNSPPRQGGMAPIQDSQRQDAALGAGLLTSKEREILLLMSRNLSNKDVARTMDLSENTIKWHVKNLFNKLDAASRKHAVARARMLGLLDA